MSPPGVDFPTATALGVIQGLTEFLPVSSSGHVALGAMLFGLRDAPLSLVIALHAGTLVATMMVFGRELGNIAQAFALALRSPRTLRETDSGRLLVAIVIGTVVTAVIGLALKSAVEQWSHVPWIVGVWLIVSALLVWSTRRAQERASELSLRGALLVGLAQGIAVLPGVSRSGATIACAMALGIRGPVAFRFSFLLSIPAIVGAVLLEVLGADAGAAIDAATALGAVVSMLVGYVSLLLLRHIVTQGRLWVFSIYLVPLGIGAMLWSAL